MERNDEIASLVDTTTKTQYAHIANIKAEIHTTQKHGDELINFNRGHHWYEKQQLPDQNWQDDIPPPIKDHETGKTRQHLDAIEYVKLKLKYESTMKKH